MSNLEQRASRLENLVRDRELVIVSNREPYSHNRDEQGGNTVDRPTGGLTAGLDPVMQRIGGTWIAWGDGDRDFDVADTDGCVSVPPEDPEYRLKRLQLSEGQVQDYYYGYSNQVLWPLCHSALTLLRCDPGFWQQYCRVNEQFADSVVEYADDQSLVWFQDYHLALAPKLARPRLPEDTTLMHFWHIPWPAWDTYRACPHRRELLEGLLGNDQVGFHTPRYQTNFLECVDAALDDAHVDWETGNVTYQGQVTTTVAVPIGVPFDRIQQTVTSSAIEAFETSSAQIDDISAGTRIAVGVDRLDYTKGIVERLRALERLWEVFPRWRGNLTFVQKGSESRSRIPAYQEVQEQVADTVDRINGRFGTDDWQPVIYTTDRLSREEMCELYRRADVGIVSPIRDGMNLVAQEYAASQVDNDGMLVLSDQAGIHDTVGEYVVTITPCDTHGFAEAIDEALTMEPVERRRRMSQIRHRIADQNLAAWVEGNLRPMLATPSRGTQSLSTAGFDGTTQP